MRPRDANRGCRADNHFGFRPLSTHLVPSRVHAYDTARIANENSPAGSRLPLPSSGLPNGVEGKRSSSSSPSHERANWKSLTAGTENWQRHLHRPGDDKWRIKRFVSSKDRKQDRRAVVRWVMILGNVSRRCFQKYCTVPLSRRD